MLVSSLRLRLPMPLRSKSSTQRSARSVTWTLYDWDVKTGRTSRAGRLWKAGSGIQLALLLAIVAWVYRDRDHGCRDEWQAQEDDGCEAQKGRQRKPKPTRDGVDAWTVLQMCNDKTAGDVLPSTFASGPRSDTRPRCNVSTQKMVRIGQKKTTETDSRCGGIDRVRQISNMSLSSVGWLVSEA